MKNYVIILTILFWATLSNAQNIEDKLFLGTVISDTLTNKTNSFKEYLNPIVDSKNKIEIRFQIYPSTRSVESVVIYYDGLWRAYKYQYDKYDGKIDKRAIERENLDEVVNRLISENIFSLKNQSELKLSNDFIDLRTGEEQTQLMGAVDGTIYFIEFKVGTKFRAYSYTNAEGFSTGFPHVQDLRQFANIVKIYKELMN
ncbi:hypothetical protein HUK80_15675 [Flavobacterium sp. MAH-1]|uniref:Uncharacterized protein n=1 Tax=Flavobacterium agri TaxID=2743471 RepID=A0A7Y8Y4C0_9FLAO|nr:hypothetical protein [Flavobacterium agri]NUY82344.1 hypothetical protein [Flavobacterium agri]NYA72368.1 hypothetical protein [Flavobacterium agri]